MELFYYTTTDTMKYILTKGDIYATNIRYMNDAEEYVNGLQEIYRLMQNKNLIGEWVKSKQGSMDLSSKADLVFSEENLEENKRDMEYYSISFCKRNDLLSQWAIYAKESGVSIRMHFEDREYCFSADSSVEQGKAAKWEIRPQEVYYFTCDSMGNMKLYEDTAFKILDQLYSEDAKDHTEGKKERWRYVSTLVKRYDFYQEEECRLVFEPNRSAYVPRIDYRLDKKVLKPYLDIYCETGWPVEEIMIGPGFNQQVVYDSVAHLLDHSNIKNGIKGVRDYAGRLERYWQPYDGSLETDSSYRKLKSRWQDGDWLDTVEMEDAVLFFNQTMDMIRESAGMGDNEKLKEYIDQRYFTKSGIVLTRSSIPYIF